MSDEDAGDRALDPIEAEVERERAGLVTTVEALRARLTGGERRIPLSAGELRGEVDRYVARRREGLVGGVESRIRAHPLETVALATVAAYPVVRMVARIPMPIALIGAGIALAGRASPQGARTREVAVGAAEPAEAPTDAPASYVGSVGSTAGSGTVRGPRVSTHPEGASAKGAGAIARTSAEAQALGREAGGGLEGVQSLYRDGMAAVSQAGRAGGETLVEAIQRRPAAAAGVSLLIGGALAMMLPRSRAEGRLMGEASQEVRTRARALAREGARSGQRVLEAARDEAAEQGLTMEGARRAVDEGREALREGVEEASERAEAAIGEAAQRADAAIGEAGDAAAETASGGAEPKAQAGGSGPKGAGPKAVGAGSAAGGDGGGTGSTGSDGTGSTGTGSTYGTGTSGAGARDGDDGGSNKAD